MHWPALLAGETLDYPNTVCRLILEIIEAARQFRKDPKGFLEAIVFDPQPSRQRSARLRLGFAVASSIYAAAFLAMMVVWTTRVSNYSTNQPVIVGLTRSELPAFIPLVANAVDDTRRAAGGGGGGDNTPNPASGGNVAIFSPAPPVVTPIPETPVNPPVLPVMETVLADPRFQPKRDELAPTGLPSAAPAPPSAGPGSNGGIGTGENGGIGPGQDAGVGDGEGGNFNGGRNTFGTPRDPRAPQQAVDSRPILLNNPRPLYTEDARTKKVQGTVRVRLLVGSDGLVKRVVVLSGLPFGLTEQAISAASQMRFTPAMKDGRPVAYWLGNVLIEFNIR
jgi:TonB family protein